MSQSHEGFRGSIAELLGSEAFGIQVRIRDVQIPEGIRKTVIAAE